MKSLNILLLGSGGRESALACKIASSPRCRHLWIAPGNGGTSAWGTNVSDISPLDFEAVGRLVEDESIDLIVPGNEDPLVAGIYDYFTARGVAVAGPSKAAAALEGSKDFAKQFMSRHGIPTAAYATFTRETAEDGKKFLATMQPPYVLKADGLAAGKGVLILPTLDEACHALDEMLAGQFGESSSHVVIEQFLDGIECSVFVITDGNGGYRILPVAKDYKRRGEGDTGLNTGGMGAVSPVPFADADFMRKVEERIIRPTVEGLRADGLEYRGFIFFGLINVGGEPMVIEYNVRMGDPETEVVMPRLESDLVDLLEGAAKGSLGELPAVQSPLAAATVIAVSDGYPGAYTKGHPVTGNLTPGAPVTVYHAGTRSVDGTPVTSGGRVLAVTSLAPTLPEALNLSYKALDNIHFQGMSFRRDIGRDVMG